MVYKQIFIDLDDTLWDFRGNSKAALEMIYELFGIKRYYRLASEFVDVYMRRNNELWMLYHHGKIEKADLVVERFRYPLMRVGVCDQRLAADMNSSYLDILSRQDRLVPYAKELLDYLGSKYPLSIISNGFTEVQFKKLSNTGISGYFDHVILSEQVGVTKPNPGIFKYALQRTGSDPSQTIMIGDNYDADITGAQSCGIAQLFFNPLRAETAGTPPSYEVQSLQEITLIL